MLEHDPRLSRFVRGELETDEIVELERELDRRPSLRRQLVELARASGIDSNPAPTSLGIFDDHRRLSLGRQLGGGGMANVRRGIQENLGRAVAVKTLRRETPSGAHRLLQEARLTSRLQHPNIVPVHEIMCGASGELQVVLKEVEGVAWSRLMRDPATIERRFGAADALDWNLGVLVAVCNALAYAHERGIIHRDVKPANVMIGDFGEVYLLDWGIAGEYGPRKELDIAHVEDAPIAGTLAYMAPEQLEGDADALGPWTDVYLLGATLYEIVARTAPFAKASKGRRPRERTVTVPDDVPAELAALLTEALAPAPEDRMVSAAKFRLAIEAFRGHRGSRDLVRRAERSRSRAAKARSANDVVAFERELAEAEFGLRAALEAWPDNTEAAEGLRAIAAERGTAARAAWDLDPRVGVAARGALLAVFAPVWIVGWVATVLWPGDSSWPTIALLATYVVFGTVAVLARGVSLLDNQFNRANILGAAVTIGGAIVWALAMQLLGRGVMMTRLGLLLLFTVIPLMFTLVTNDRRGLLPSLINLGCFAAAALAPEYAGHALVASAVGLAASTVINNILLRRAQARA